jgi:hypothetical protein
MSQCNLCQRRLLGFFLFVVTRVGSVFYSYCYTCWRVAGSSGAVTGQDDARGRESRWRHIRRRPLQGAGAVPRESQREYRTTTLA